jgi:general secretion pathway protein G
MVKHKRQGFTVIELLVVLAAVAVLLMISTPRYIAHLDHARETALRHNLKNMREAIDQFQADKGRTPAGLLELVQARYLRDMPEDPITQRRDTWVWQVGAPEGFNANAPLGAVSVRSGAPGLARDGSAYASW